MSVSAPSRSLELGSRVFLARCPDRSVKKEEEMFLYLECGHFISRIYSRSNTRITFRCSVTSRYKNTFRVSSHNTQPCIRPSYLAGITFCMIFSTTIDKAAGTLAQAAQELALILESHAVAASLMLQPNPDPAVDGEQLEDGRVPTGLKHTLLFEDFTCTGPEEAGLGSCSDISHLVYFTPLPVPLICFALNSSLPYLYKRTELSDGRRTCLTLTGLSTCTNPFT
ncbi:unnamed protein product [Pleuronectes platessa]|uniref:Uncharacterized protein n=1 Tax=Pleuronectes platessa TaxID=8262 RepID=A0A9N7YB34_PLEPL|nr:unnamed protein product [Pleuronectes platessa]